MIVQELLDFVLLPFSLSFLFFLFRFLVLCRCLLLLDLLLLVELFSVWGQVGELVHLQEFLYPLSPLIKHVSLDGWLLVLLDLILNFVLVLFELLLFVFLEDFEFLPLALNLLDEWLQNVFFVNSQELHLFLSHLMQLLPPQKCSPVLLDDDGSVFLFVVDLCSSVFLKLVPKLVELQSSDYPLPSPL